jgi:RES domain-containing protein
VRIYRLCKERYSANLLAGEGGMHADGRWPSQGRPIVYCATSESLAVLELRVHIGAFLPRDRYAMHEIEIKDSLIEHYDPAILPAGWDAVPHSSISQTIGDAWLEKLESPALRIPSIHSRTEHNVLINPVHNLASSFLIHRTWTYQFDPRMFSS